VADVNAPNAATFSTRAAAFSSMLSLCPPTPRRNGCSGYMPRSAFFDVAPPTAPKAPK
jgi:hypothetical protein